MMLIEETTFADEVLPVEEFKAHLKVGTGFEDDSLQDGTLITFLRAALSAIEARTGKALIARDFAWTIHEWANPMGEAFPVAPVGSMYGGVPGRHPVNSRERGTRRGIGRDAWRNRRLARSSCVLS